jgi:gliding motility-associated-like protein
MKRKFILFLFLIFSLTSFSQTLIMNEVSQGVTGNMEYVEFVVVDTAAAYNCGLSVPPSIDIRGWIFDDNSGYHGTGGIAAGAIRFSNDPLWAAIPMGTLILIYNDASPDPSIPTIDLSLSDGNCSIIAPISSPTLFESNNTTPGAIACSYPSTGWTPGGNWSNTLLANSGDCARIVNLLGCEVFSVCYGDVNLNTQIYFSAGAELTSDHRNTVYYFNDGDPLVQSNWTLACTDDEIFLDANQCGGNFQTPGLPNNPENGAFIGQFNNNCTPIPPLVASAVVDANEACGCDGQATAMPSGSIPGYTYEWLDALMSPIGQTSQTATGLCAGTYHVTITSSIGCTETATVSVNPGLSPSSSSISGGGSYCVNVTPTGVDVTISLTGTGPWDLVYTDGTTTYTLNNVTSSPVVLNNVTSGEYQVTSLTDVSGCPGTSPGSVTVNALAVPTALISGGNDYCAGALVNDITVAVTGAPSWTLSYTVDGGATQTTTATSSPISLGNSPGSYSITSITDANCTGVASGSQTIVVNPLPVISSINGGGTYCAGDMVGDVTVDVTGSPGWTVSYSIDGGPTQTVSASSSPISLGNADGVYNITAISDVNCTNTASGTQEISINPLPAVISFSGGSNYCEGDVIGEIFVDVSGSPVWTLTYSIDGGPLQTITGSTSPISLGNLEGVYLLTAISDAFCSNSTSVTQTILINPVPSAPLAGTDATYCIGSELLPMTVSGGSGGFVWYSDETLTNPIGNGSTMMPSEILGSSNYYVNEQLNGCSGPADIVTINIIPCDITIPTAFTPDGDNVNDVWNIQDLDLNYPENQVFVYNRWGSLLYASDKGKYSTKPWNGTFNDKELPVGSYYFIIETGDEPLNGIVSIVTE